LIETAPVTTKLIAALYGERPRPAAHEPALRARLAP
jgi:hypothetical protein